MVEDFTTFRQIEATEYVDDLFELRSGYGTPSLSLFCELVNREMMWTISEVSLQFSKTSLFIYPLFPGPSCLVDLLIRQTRYNLLIYEFPIFDRL